MNYLAYEALKNFLNELKAISSAHMSSLIQIVQRLLNENLFISGQTIISDLNALLRSDNSRIKEHANVLLGICYYFGIIVQKNLKTAVKCYQEAAELENRIAINYLGFCYENGEGVEKDIKKAIKFYKHAAALEYSTGINNYGVCYEMGEGIEKDIKKAVELYKKAVALGNSEAMNNLAMLYKKGMGVEKDPKKSVELYRQAAVLGNSRGICLLGLCYKNGADIEKDVREAAKLFKQAAALGYPAAIYNLGDCYLRGMGIGKDVKKAMEHFREAAELRNVSAITHLADAYRLGKGVEQDFKRALELSEQALQLGSPHAKKQLISLAWSSILEGKLEFFKEIVLKKYFDVGSVNENYYTPLYLAGIHDQIDIFEFLLCQGAYFDCFAIDDFRLGENFNAETYFASLGKYEIVVILKHVERLFDAVEKNNTPSERLLSVLWYAVNARRRQDDNTILHLSLISETPNIDFIVKMIDSSPNLNMKNSKNETVIDLLSAHNHPFLKTLGLCFQAQMIYDHIKSSCPTPNIAIKSVIRGLDETDNNNYTTIRSEQKRKKEYREAKETKINDVQGDKLSQIISEIETYLEISSEPSIRLSRIHFMLGKLLGDLEKTIDALKAIAHLEKVDGSNVSHFEEANNILTHLYIRVDATLERILKAMMQAGQTLDPSFPIIQLIYSYFFKQGIKHIPQFKNLSDPASLFELFKLLKENFSELLQATPSTLELTQTKDRDTLGKHLLVKFNTLKLERHSETRLAHIKDLVLLKNDLKNNDLF